METVWKLSVWKRVEEEKESRGKTRREEEKQPPLTPIGPIFTLATSEESQLSFSLLFALSYHTPNHPPFPTCLPPSALPGGRVALSNHRRTAPPSAERISTLAPSIESTRREFQALPTPRLPDVGEIIVRPVPCEGHSKPSLATQPCPKTRISRLTPTRWGLLIGGDQASTTMCPPSLTRRMNWRRRTVRLMMRGA